MSRTAPFLAISLILLAGTARPMGNPDPAAAIAATIRQSYLGSARVCYERGRKEDPALGGRLDLVLTVGSHGRVTRARVASSQLGPTVEGCLETAARGWSFSRSGRPVTVTYPFVFRAR